jgi:hypothetical protein
MVKVTKCLSLFVSIPPKDLSITVAKHHTTSKGIHKDLLSTLGLAKLEVEAGTTTRQSISGLAST